PVVDMKRLVPDAVVVDIYESVPDRRSWRFAPLERTESYMAPSFGFVDVPKKYSAKAIQIDRSGPFLLRAQGAFTLAPGPWRVLVRCRNAGRLYVDGQLVAETLFHNISNSGHGKVEFPTTTLAPHIRPLARGDTETVGHLQGDGRAHVFVFEMVVGGQTHRPE